MDSETVVESVKKTGRCVTVEEGFPQSGVGAEIAARLMVDAFDYLDAPVLRITGKDVPMPYAANLEKLALPNVAEVIEAAKAVCYGSPNERRAPLRGPRDPPTPSSRAGSRCCAPRWWTAR